MANEDGSVQLTFNGEIYNFRELRTRLESAGHVFRSQTDSEVIVHGYVEWGDGVVEQLRGMFTFAIWDERRQRLLLARDRLGIKPAYYALRGGEFSFASESRALLHAGAAKAEVEPLAVMQLLRDSFIHGGRSVWRGISRLPPATTLVFESTSGVVSMTRYWRPPQVDPDCESNTAAATLARLLEESVAEQLVADVPVGCFLSGGLDSSLVCTFAARHSPRIRSFFADFPGWPGSERADAQLVATHLGTTHLVEDIDGPLSEPHMDASMSGMFDAFDEPIGDMAIVPTWYLARSMSRFVKVALSGDGGDELFAGYSRYERVAATPRRRIAWAVERTRRRLGRGRPWPEGCADAGEYFRFLLCPGFSTTELTLLFPDWALEAEASGHDYFRPPSKGQISTRAWRQHDLEDYLVDNNLARVDRCSMAHGLEVRVPLLDHRIAECAMSLPDSLNSPERGGKHLLRRLAQPLLPSRVLEKRKQGFSFPLDRYLASDDMANAIQLGALVKGGLLCSAALSNWLAARPGGNFPTKLWLLFVLEQWASRWLLAARKVGT